MENNRTDRQPRTVDFSLFDQIEKAVPAYDLDKAIQKRDYRIDLTQHYADAEYLLTVDGIGMLAKGDIQAVKGKAKQGKTFFITALVAAVLNGKFGALKASGEDYRVLIVDTEQNMKNVARNARKIHRLCGWPENENHQEPFWRNLSGRTDAGTGISGRRTYSDQHGSGSSDLCNDRNISAG